MTIQALAIEYNFLCNIPDKNDQILAVTIEIPYFEHAKVDYCSACLFIY